MTPALEGSHLADPATWERFWAKVDVQPGQCWLWTASPTAAGYGALSFKLPARKHRLRYAHRLTWEALVGPIPDGMQIDHLCRVRLCVNPDHLEPVTQAVNVRRGIAGDAARRRQTDKTHCKRGHAYSGYNLVTTEKQRVCRTCRQISNRNSRLRKRAAL